MDELLKYIEDFVRERDWEQFHSENNLAKSIVLEANELLEHYQFSPDCDNDREGVRDELADIMTYCLMFCNRIKEDPIDLVYRKMRKNAEKYPAEKARGSNKKYTEL